MNLPPFTPNDITQSMNDDDNNHDEEDMDDRYGMSDKEKNVLLNNKSIRSIEIWRSRRHVSGKHSFFLFCFVLFSGF